MNKRGRTSKVIPTITGSVLRNVLLVIAAIGLGGFAARGQEPYPLSRQLQVLEEDLASPAYREVLPTMIQTDLAAEWQRVATPDNYHVFAEEHGGLDRVQQDPQLRGAYERRKQIADAFLEIMRSAYKEKGRPAPFDDEDVLIRTLASAASRTSDAQLAEIPIRSVLAAPDADQHWPNFRGPTAQGIVIDARIPETWSATQNIRWRAPLPGRGNSSPVVWGDRIFVTAEGPRDDRPDAANSGEADKNTGPARLLLCFDRRDGSLLWEHAAPPPSELETLYWKNTFASSTPVCDGERVIAFFGNSGLICCDLQGERLWHRDLGTFPTMHGPGAAPVLYQDLVILFQDQTQGKSLCAAFDKRTGETRWQKQRPNQPGWSTPVVLRVGDRDELIFNGSHYVVSYDPLTGEEIWRLGGTTQESIPMIIAGGGLLYSTSGRNGPTLAIRPGGEGDITDTHLVWRNPRGASHVPSPTYHDGRLYLIVDLGIMTCLDARDGSTLWQQRLRGRFSMSPLLVGDRLLVTNEDGVTYILKSSPKYELLGTNDLEETVLATPAILDGCIYFRTAEHLVCVGESESAATR